MASAMASTSRIAFLCLLGLLLVSPAISAALQFDFFYLVLMWPGAYCAQTKAGCCRPTTGDPTDDFFVSGLTTYDLNYDEPATGCNSDPFYIDQLTGIKGELTQYWSNIKCPSNNGKSTWKSAWKKYGVCSGLEELSYFKAALALRAKVNPLALLVAKGIKPDYNLYSVEDIKAAIKAGVGVTPVIRCSKGPFGKYQLYEIHLCVAADAETFIECPTVPKFTCSDKILFHPFRKWMLNSTASYANPDELPDVAME